MHIRKKNSISKYIVGCNHVTTFQYQKHRTTLCGYVFYLVLVIAILSSFLNEIVVEQVNQLLSLVSTMESIVTASASAITPVVSSVVSIAKSASVSTEEPASFVHAKPI